MISPKSIEDVISTARIEEVVDDFVTLKRRGTNMIGVCPFHDEKTPSFVVSPAKGIFKCFGCGKGGTALNFIMEHESLSYTEAIRYLANKYNIELEETKVSQEDMEAKQVSDSYYIVNEFAKQYYQDQLFHTDEGKSIGLSYFKERGFLESTIKAFGLGYALNEKDTFTKTALQKQFKIEHLKHLGLTTKNDIDFFRARVMFSIHNLSGKVVALAGRIMTNDKNQPKYINSPESEIYIKHKVLYGLYQAKTAIRKEDECILVEGYTDVITLHQGGVQNVVSSSGTALNKDQVKLISRFTQNVKLIYDGDNAGINAALRGLDIILEEGLNVRLVLLPNNEDPDSFFKSVGTEQFKQYLKQKEKDFILFKAEHLLKSVGSDPIRKVEAYKDIIDSIARVDDAMKRHTYIQLCSKLMEMDESILIKEVSKIIDQRLKSKRQQEQRDKLRADRAGQSNVNYESEVDRNDQSFINLKPTVIDTLGKDEFQEKDLVRILITGGDKLYAPDRDITIAQYLITNLEDSLDLFQNELYKKVFKYAVEQDRLNKLISEQSFINHPDQSISSLAIDMSTSPFTYAKWEERNIFLQTQKPPDENFQRDAYQAILRFKLKKITQQIIDSTAALENPEMEEDERNLELKVLSQMTKERNEIAKMLNTVILH